MNFTIERLDQINQEREQTMSDTHFQKWMRELKVSQLYTDRTALFNAHDINKQYNYGNYHYRVKNILQY